MTTIKSQFKKGTKYQQVLTTLSYTATSNCSKLGWFQMHPSQQLNSCCFTLLEEKKCKKTIEEKKSIRTLNLSTPLFLLATGYRTGKARRVQDRDPVQEVKACAASCPFGRRAGLPTTTSALRQPPLSSGITPCCQHSHGGSKPGTSKEWAATTFIPERSSGEMRAPRVPNPPKETLCTCKIYSLGFQINSLLNLLQVQQVGTR